MCSWDGCNKQPTTRKRLGWNFRVRKNSGKKGVVTSQRERKEEVQHGGEVTPHFRTEVNINGLN